MHLSASLGVMMTPHSKAATTHPTPQQHTLPHTPAWGSSIPHLLPRPLPQQARRPPHQRQPRNVVHEGEGQERRQQGRDDGGRGVGADGAGREEEYPVSTCLSDWRRCRGASETLQSN
jgi:hypothetical protein